MIMIISLSSRILNEKKLKIENCYTAQQFRAVFKVNKRYFINFIQFCTNENRFMIFRLLSKINSAVCAQKVIDRESQMLRLIVINFCR